MAKRITHPTDTAQLLKDLRSDKACRCGHCNRVTYDHRLRNQRGSVICAECHATAPGAYVATECDAEGNPIVLH